MAHLLPPQEFGKKLAALREERGLTQAGLAQRLGKTSTDVSRWENGHVQPRYDTAVDIAGALEVPVAEFLKEGAAAAGAVQEVAAVYGKRAEGLEEATPTLAHLDWLPPLLELVLKDPHLSAMEKQGLMAELNAAGMRYWAVSAEWAAGQRGIAMQKAEVASGERAKANGREADGARARASALGIEVSEVTTPVAGGAAEERREKTTKRAHRGGRGRSGGTQQDVGGA